VHGRAGISFSQVTVNQEGNHLTTPAASAFSDTHDYTGGRFGAGLAYQLTDHVGAAVDYYYSYIPTSSFSINDYSTMLQLDDRLNYVGFSLFYTVLYSLLPSSL
jgi:opacity protein-like surface antigen